jgi:hypothetical protein
MLMVPSFFFFLFFFSNFPKPVYPIFTDVLMVSSKI